MIERIRKAMKMATGSAARPNELGSLSKAFVVAMSLFCERGGRTKTAKTVLVGMASP